MEKEHNYIECQACAWRVKLDGYDPYKELCKRCNNTRKVVDPNEILCNLCGKTMCPIGTMNEQYPHGLHEVKITGGYDSYHLLDMNEYTFSFCEECLRKLFTQCKIPPKVSDISSYGGEYSFADDQESYEYRVWKDQGEFHQAYLNRKCNFKKDCINDAIYTQLISGDFTEGSSCEEHKDSWQFSNSTMVKFIPHTLKVFL